MDVQEWIEKSRSLILEQAQNRPWFGPPENELKELHLELTYACNMKCRMCDVWSKYGKDPSLPRKEMSVEELIDYVQESRVLKRIKGVVISGGEPFLKKDIVTLIGYFITSFSCARVGILSNLYNPKLTYLRLSEAAKKYDINKLWIGTSLDGLSVSHNNTRGVQDAFEKFKQTLYVIKTDFPHLPVTVNYTLTTDNFHDLFSTYRFCRNNNLSLSVQFPVSWKDAETFTFTEEQLSAIESQILKILEQEIKDFYLGGIDERGLLAKIFYLHGMIDYQRNPRRVFRKCIAGRSFVTFSPEGKLYFCPLLKHITVGDLREKPFDVIWTDKKARELRKKIDRSFCHCWLNCTIYPNASEALRENNCNEQKKVLNLSILPFNKGEVEGISGRKSCRRRRPKFLERILG